MAGDLTAFLDTSVLLAGIVELGDASRAPQRVMTAIANGKLPRPRTAWHCCLELYSVCTRLPHELRVSAADAARLVEEEVLSRFDVHGLPSRARLSFVRMVGVDGITGGRVYDAHIGEVARRAGTRILVTDNRRHFTSLLRHGIRVIPTAEYAAEAGV